MLRRIVFILLASVLVARGLLGGAMAMETVHTSTPAHAQASAGHGHEAAAPLASGAAAEHCTPDASGTDCGGVHAGACAACHLAPRTDPPATVAVAAPAVPRPERATRFASAMAVRTLRPPIG